MSRENPFKATLPEKSAFVAEGERVRVLFSVSVIFVSLGFVLRSSHEDAILLERREKKRAGRVKYLKIKDKRHSPYFLKFYKKISKDRLDI